MEVLDIAEEQLNSTDQVGIVDDYGDYFREIRNFGPEGREYLRATRKRVEGLDEGLAKKGRSRIKGVAKEKVCRLREVVGLEEEPGLLVFIGDGVPDGHGILLEGRPWIIIDLKTFVDRLDTYDQEVYLTHEISHCFHYAKSPSFYFGNDRGSFASPPIFKMMVVEGVATYLSFLFTSAAIQEAFWFGQYDEEEVEGWMDSCEREKEVISDKADASGGEVPPELLEQLFDVPDRDLGRSRMGYYYGTQIFRKVVERKGLKPALNLDLEGYEPYVRSYFDL